MSNRATTTTDRVTPRKRQWTTRQRNARNETPSDENAPITPQALEAEQSTLGAMIIERPALIKVLEILSGDDFYREIHRKIFAIVVALFEAGGPVDFITVVEEARRRGELDEIGGAAYVGALIEACPSAANVATYANLVLETANKRAAIAAAEQLSYMGYNGNTGGEVLDFLRESLESLEKRDAGARRPKIWKGADFMRERFERPVMTVPGLMPAGLVLCSGDQKIGKSYYALQLGIAVAAGGRALGHIPVERGDALYCALESVEYETQERIETYLQEQEQLPDNFEIAFEWPSLGEGCELEIERWLDDHPNARLVIIDTLIAVRRRRASNSNIYDEDYFELEALHKLAKARGITILLLHHNNKGNAENPFDRASGSRGRTGVVDAEQALVRRPGQQEAELHVRGRGLPDTVFALNFDKHDCTWTILGEGDDVRMSREQKEIIDLLNQNGGAPLNWRSIHDLRETDCRPASTYRQCFRMHNAGLLTKFGDNEYGLPKEEQQPVAVQTAPAQMPPTQIAAEEQNNPDICCHSCHTCQSEGTTGDEPDAYRGSSAAAPVASETGISRSNPPQNEEIAPEGGAVIEAAPPPPETPLTGMTAMTANIEVSDEGREKAVDNSPEQSDREVLEDVALVCRLDLATDYWEEHRSRLIRFAREWLKEHSGPPVGSAFDYHWPRWLELQGEGGGGG